MVRASGCYRHRPIVFGDAAPEAPYCTNCQKSEKCLEQCAVNLAAGGVAEVNADHVFEDLSDGEQQGGSSQVDYRQVRESDETQQRYPKIGCKLTHWSNFAQDPNNQDSFQHVKRDEADERKELVQHIESNVAIIVCLGCREFTRPVKSRVQGNIARTDEENQGGGKD